MFERTSSPNSKLAEAPSALYAADEVGKPRPLEVGIFLDSVEGLAWVERVLLDIAQSRYANLRLVILQGGKSGSRRGWLARLVRGELDCALWTLYRALDERVHREKRGAFRNVDLSEALASADVVTLVSTDRERVRRIDPETLDAIRARDLDVLLRFDPAGPIGELHDAARYGVWSSRHGPRDEIRPGPALLVALSEATSMQATIVEIVVEAPQGMQTICRSHATTGESIWLSNHQEVACWRTTLLLMRQLRRLSRRGSETTMPPDNSGRHSAAETRPCPRNRDMMRFVLRRGRYLLQKKWQLFSKQTQWFLAYRTDAPKFVANSKEIDLSGLTPILPPRDHFYADPHVFQHGEQDYVFFEDWNCLARRGSISVVIVDGDGNVGSPQRALECEHHLSYPFVFEWDDEVYMIPDASETNALPLYRATRFPCEWAFSTELMHGREMVDPTLHCHEGKWFLFVNVRERPSGSLNDELFLFFADTPLGPWRPHPDNPIKSDVRSARPAGRLFRRGGRLIRPSQDCATLYGSAINLCEVDVLSATEYRERIVDRVEPTWWPTLQGCHTLSASDRVEVVDARRSIGRFSSVRTNRSLPLDRDFGD